VPLQYNEIALHARLLDAELAEHPTELAAAADALTSLRASLEHDGFTAARWQAELGLAAVARKQGDAARADRLAAGVEREARTAGFRRQARLAAEFRRAL
jgi:hypothetical protein